MWCGWKVSGVVWRVSSSAMGVKRCGVVGKEAVWCGGKGSGVVWLESKRCGVVGK